MSKLRVKSNLKSFTKKQEIYSTAISDYQNIMRVLGRQLTHFNQKIYGYGASSMLATLAYHLKSALSELICILDDDGKKDGCSYQNLSVQIRHPLKMHIPKNSNFFITSLENTRIIFKKIIDLSPRRILIPMTV